MQNVEENWKLDEMTSIEQRHKDVFGQPRKRWQLQPIPVPLLPYVTKSCRETNKYVIRPKVSRVASEDSYFEIDHLLMKNFPTVSIKGVDVKDNSKFDIYLRFTNPNMSICVVKILKLKESQVKTVDANCSVSFPANDLQINFHNDLIGSGDLEISTEIQRVEIKDEDKPFIKDCDKNFILFKLPGRMKEGFD
jgi:hypothetical protein